MVKLIRFNVGAGFNVRSFIIPENIIAGLPDVKLSCNEGMCRPTYKGQYQDTCKEICGYSSCLDAQEDIEECDVTKHHKGSSNVMSPEEESVCLCFNGNKNH